jgi:bifunctional oligoribonuclease and PAP phosphatase NrnA
MNSDTTKALKKLVDGSKSILVLQPEKPDTDSMTTSLALEQILGELGKEVLLFCQDKIPNYISNFEGADRVIEEFPEKFDMTILVDTGGPSMISRTLEKHQGKLVKKPFVVIDHHPTREPMPFETIDIIDGKATSTCEVVFELAELNGWKVNSAAANLMVPGIIADTRNLSISTVGAKEFRLMAKLVDLGANIFQIHESYRKMNTLSMELLQLKGRLLNRIETFADGKIAFLLVTPGELKQYSELHDPIDLVIYEMQRAEGVEVAVGMRNYGGDSKKIKVSTRANMPVAALACAEFGGGGHDRAAGCQFNDTVVGEAKAAFIKTLTAKIHEYEAAQHAI